MSRGGVHSVAVVLLVAAFVLHSDIWWWNDSSSVLGLPIGLLYHLALCFAASAIFAVLIRSGSLAERDLDGDEEP